MTEQLPNNPDSDNTTDEADRQAARRRLIRGSIAAGPVILTLASQPVFAAQCVAPSQTLSAALSHPSNQLGTCNGESPGYWKNNAKPNPPGINRFTAKFHDVFTEMGGPGKRFFKPAPVGSTGEIALTLQEVLDLNGTQDLEKVAFHLVGAYLNILAGAVNFPVGGVVSQTSMTNVMKLIWREWVLKGYYEPFAGKKWYGPDIKAYLIGQGIVA